ncbi:TRAFAC clade GTPase domain-containing protein [Azospirillum sp. sgz301742]
MSRACTFEGCAVGETGVCALEHDLATCKHYAAAKNPAVGNAEAVATESAPAEPADDFGAPVLEKPTGAASFPSSRTLGPEFVSGMMGSRYVTVVGILGDPESGKTACLVSLYLMVANAQLEGWSFADSRSLMGFEEIARGAREWNEGQPPDQMTVHTEMADDRRPGFLHLRLVRRADGRCVDLALPDLPGEWTTALVSTAHADRFDFMKSAEAIWVVVDGRTLADKERRQGVISRLGQLAGRLRTIFDGTIPRMMIVVTHRDHGELDGSITNRIAAELMKREVVARIHHVASFSEHGDVRAGFGLAELVEATVAPQQSGSEFWPSSEPDECSRSYLSFRRDR